MKNALFTKDGKWFLIPELPESPVYPGHEVQRLYDKALAEAIANALPVANPEVIAGFFNRPLNEVEKDRMYQWPGTLELTHPELGTVKILEPGSGSIWVTWKGGKTNVYHSDLQVTLILPTANGSVAAPKEEPKICPTCGKVMD